MTLVKGKSAPIREKRLQAISAYLGKPEELLQELQQEEIKQRIRTFAQATVDDVGNVLRLLSGIEEVSVVVHGPRGCGASQLYWESSKAHKNRWAVTNLDEQDTIMGGEDSLRQAILKLHNRYPGQVIFVVTTPVVAINNDDVFAVVDQLREELGVLIIPIYADGFKSKTGVSGYDTALHALLKYLPIDKAQVKRENLVNVLSVTENSQDIDEIKRLLEAVKVEANFLPRTVLQNFTAAAQAQVSISVNPDECNYLGRILEEQFGVPFLWQQPPIGIKGTQAWLDALGSAIGLEEQLDELHNKEREWLDLQISKYNFTQVKVYVNLPTSLAWGVIDLVEEFGAQVAGVTVDQLDRSQQLALEKFIARHQDSLLHIASGQQFEQAAILERLKPDIYIGSAADASWAAKSGIAAVAVDHIPILGYRGVVNVARQLHKALSNQQFVQKLQQNLVRPYQAQWYKKNPNWHIKMEVK